MTTYTPISDAETQTGAIVSQSLMRALRDNTRALAEDDVSVPPVDTIKRLGRQNRIVVGVAADDGVNLLQVGGIARANQFVAIGAVGPFLSGTVTAEANPRIAIDMSGLHGWGTGAAAADVTLSRNGVGTLLCSGSMGLRGVPYVWPAANALGALSNDGAGNLTWIPGGAVSAFYAGINNATAVAITGAIAATANRMHNVSGTAADYDITLPVAPATGTVVGLNVLPFAAANKQYRLDAGVGVVVCGRTRFLVLLHTNVALLRWDGTRWNPLVLSLDTPWINAGPSVVTATTTNPVKGTGTTLDETYWRRIGPSIEIRWQYRQTVAGTFGTGDYLWGMPVGSIDVAKVPADTAAYSDNTAGVFGLGYGKGDPGSGDGDSRWVGVYDATRVRQFKIQNNNANEGFIGGTSLMGGFGNAANRFVVTANLPLLDW